jgi:hypothetical protein
MALQSAFQDLCLQLQQLCEALRGLRSIVGDKPLKGDVALVDRYSDGADDMLGWTKDALAAANKGARAVDSPIDLERARGELIAVQELYNTIAEYLNFQLLQGDSREELASLGRERQGEWRAWANTVEQMLDRLQRPLHGVNRALLQSWREMAERAGTTSVSVKTTTVGQNIAYPRGRRPRRSGIPG